MTYFGFLAVFLVIPILLLWALARRDAQRNILPPPMMRSWPSWMIILAHAIIAVVYTTPWDNYLVATRVWWYNPDLVTGMVIWYVPIEEYTFFVLQPLLTGAWLYLMARHLRLNISEVPLVNRHSIRRNTTALVFLIWSAFVLLLISGWQPGTYMGLLMVWALPPVMIQTAFGADILWKNRRLIVLTVVPTTLYLAAADKLAITSGTWTINPEQSLGINLIERLPIEELVFFFMTNLLIGFGITLVSSVESRARAEGYVRALKAMVSRGQDRSALTEKS